VAVEPDHFGVGEVVSCNVTGGKFVQSFNYSCIFDGQEVPAEVKNKQKF
jgi:hypothetical protein